ncbi:MAG: type II toxin-antitoxin system RelE/ParE family toxin [Rhodanobacteraceae bacterium]|nr:type II toxin-antitoxin system RelE/ParE family toxin [Rhodanobacteraceae bacterium]
MSFRVRFTQEARADLERLYDFILQRDADDFALATKALAAIRDAIGPLETFSFSCRKATPANPFLRELLIPFGTTGYVALFEIEDAHTVTVLAVRHQREDDYH